MGALGLLKRPNPPAVLRVDSSTGKVDVLPTTANGHVTFSEKTDRADLHRYVELRESYDWETISDTHAAVMFMSDDHEKEAYDGLVRGPVGPLKLLKDQARVIAHVGSITFADPTAQVFFSRQLVPLNPAAKRPDPTYWIATVAFERVNVPEKQDQQDLNADGFRCTSYEVTRDWTRAPADAGASGRRRALRQPEVEHERTNDPDVSRRSGGRDWVSRWRRSTRERSKRRAAAVQTRTSSARPTIRTRRIVWRPCRGVR